MTTSDSASANQGKRLSRGLFALALPIAIALGYACWLQAYRVPLGAHIADMSLAALRWDEARLRLDDFKIEREKRAISWAVGARACVGTPEAMGITLDTEATLRRLRELSKRRGFWSRLFGVDTALLAEFQLQEDKFQAWVDSCEKLAIKTRPVAGRLVAKEGTKDGSMEVVPSQAGQRIHVAKLRESIPAALVKVDDSSIPVSLSEVPELPSRASLQRAKERASAMTQKPVILLSSATQKKITLLRSELVKMFDFRPSKGEELEFALSRPAFEQWLGSRRHRVEQPAQNATYKLEGAKLVLVPEAPGNKIAVDALFERLAAALLNGEREVSIPFEPTEMPTLHREDVEKLNIHELVSSFTTRHACCQARVQNIHRIAELLNGVIVLPGAVFSINETVGPRTLERGFVAAPSIQDGDMMDSIGGGISQFATTFYNAAMRGGYEILERQAHSYWFDRYPMGHEATLNWPKPDLVIRNDTASGLLILTSYDDRSITVKFYGDREGRHVTWGVSGRSDIVLPKTEYLPNPEIEPDEEKVREGGCIGWTVTTTRTVTAKGRVIHEDKRKIVYKPRIRRVDVHPCRIPPGEPGASGEKCPKTEKSETQPAETPNGAAVAAPPPAQEGTTE